MHLAYSALNPIDDVERITYKDLQDTRILKLRYRAYKAACKKYQHEIEAIQQYMPHWQPVFK